MKTNLQFYSYTEFKIVHNILFKLKSILNFKPRDELEKVFNDTIKSNILPIQGSSTFMGREAFR